MSFRKEYKFSVSSFEREKLRSYLFLQGMECLYESRIISSVYYDTSNLNCYFDSEEGCLPRKKFRIRFYNKNKSFLHKEIKVSSIEGRFKSVERIFTKEFLDDWSMDFVDGLYGKLSPSTFVVYQRHYYKFRGLRITIDQDIKYKMLRNSGDFWFIEPLSVLEVKCPNEIFDDNVENIIPATQSRFSKYCRSVNAGLGRHIR